MVDDDRLRELLGSAEGPRALHDDELARIRSRLDPSAGRAGHVGDAAQIDLLVHPKVPTHRSSRRHVVLAVAAASALMVVGFALLATGRDGDRAGPTDGLSISEDVAESTARSSPASEPCPDQPPDARSDQMNSTQNPRNAVTSIAVATTLLLSSCASDSGDAGSAAAQEPPAATLGDAEAADASEPVDGDAQAANDDEPLPDEDSVNDGSDSTAPPRDDGSESCGSDCPLTEEVQAIVDEFFEAYNGDDWEAWLGTLATDEPTWQLNPGYVQPTEQLQEDFVWAAALNQTATPERCIEQFGTIRCEVTVEDDFHRGLADYGLEPGRCTMAMSLDEGALEPQSKVGETHNQRGLVERRGCAEDYTILDKDYREWLVENHPGSVPPETDTVDAASIFEAASHLTEWLALVDDAIATDCQYGPLRNPTC